ncbi:bifunctional diguanylate cyclase/phosphodiesterase [Marinomonas posidonica]|uniref:cyclic-guanylate-specific phosphodiesterase n=1 Tax=Marinomonas posidonica (strain CECT 7376 / NCIMB 14433 / IVIA-Po-181) TaxID=491952 RepID=F6CYP0_MARPP|nr:EAL domain-containing protein [Marinomonas posidonica]AEF55722.1 diguanylate cyclase/phosphodiesterase with Chase sensor [Marinomonas posidonica IVIA-Po-181]
MKQARLKQPLALGIVSIAFCFIVLLGGYWTQSASHSIVHQKSSILNGLSRSQASALERRLASAFTSAKIMSYEVELHNGHSPWFDSYANRLIESIGGIENIQLAPNGIIQKIYPLAGNEKAIGLDIINSTKYHEATQQAIITKKMIAIGPVSLIQGGVAVISRAPIYLNRGQDNESFWGFASSLVYLDHLIAATQLKELEQDGYQYELWRPHNDKEERITLSSSSAPLSDLKSSSKLILPVGTWTLTISQNIANELEANRFKGYSISFIIGILLSIALYALLIQPLKLSKLVKEKTAALQDLAYRDPLTSLPNRRHLHDNLPNTLYKNQLRSRISAFIYFDLDNFKRINDTVGHDIGDQVLVIIADRLNALKGLSDQVVRLGGDEFGILLGNIKSTEEAESFATKILKSVQIPITFNQREFTLSTSLGIAMIPEHGYDLVTIMQNADMALYHAKQLGKNQFSMYTESMKVNTHNSIKAEDDLSQALKNQEFVLYYQPQFDLHTNHIIGAEALIRWNHPEKGLIYPNEFIPVAEKTGQIVELGHWVIETGIAYLAERKEAGLSDILLHINLASKQLADPYFVCHVEKLLIQYQVPARQLGFEITETDILEDIELAKSLLKSLKKMGVCIAIDDFGTGYSSLAQLKNLPVDLLKIDRNFIKDITEDENDRNIVEAIIAMAHKLNIKVLTEGIETRQQWQMLADFQCNFGQGFYVSRAVAAEAFNKTLPTIHHNEEN